MMVNVKVRKALKENGIKQWELASMLNVSEQTIYRKLRSELPMEEQERIVKIIEANRKEN